MSNGLRPALRRVVPHGGRWRLRALRRVIDDAREGITFADVREPASQFAHRLSCYSLPIACYPGQEDRYAGKLRNLSLALGAIDGAVVGPAEVLSFWRLVGRPTRSAGYAPAAALKSGRLIEEVGGSICLASTVLYNTGLLAAMGIVERFCHSVDTYGENRYFELGRDAAVEYAYRDLRMRNDLTAPVLIRAGLAAGRAFAEAWGEEDVRLAVELEVGPVSCVPRPPSASDNWTPGIEVRTWRKVSLDGTTRIEDLGLSRHEPYLTAARRDPQERTA